MAERTITKRICDRPNCGATVTENGGRFALASNEPTGPTAVAPAESIQGMDDHMAFRTITVRAFSVDLCRTCAASLRLWWTARLRREQGDEQVAGEGS